MCGLAARLRCGRHACEQRKVPRVLISIMRSKRLIGVSSVPVRLIALALLTRTSMPPKRFRGLDGRPYLILEADVGSHGEGLAAGGFDLPRGRENGARQLRMRLGRLGRNHYICAVPRGPEPDCKPDTPGGASDEERLSLEVRHRSSPDVRQKLPQTAGEPQRR